MMLLLAAVMLSGGCGVKLAYNNMDRFARWGMSDYVDINAEQRAYFDAEIDKILYWHRTEQLPEYAALFESLESQFADGTSRAEMQAIGDQFFLWYEDIEAQLLPFGIEMLLSLTPEQVAELPEKLQRDNAELAEDETGLTVKESQARWQQEYVDGFSRFSGRLNPDQKAYLTEQSVRYIPQYDLWADYRRRWQADVMQLVVEGRDDPAAFDKAFRDLVARRIPVYYGDELTAIFDHNELLYQDVTVWLINNLTDKQKERLFTRIQDLARDFRELTAEAAPEPPTDTVCLVRC